VHKFGGTCVATADRIAEAAKLIVSDPHGTKVMVVSAMGSHPSSPVKVTDLLINMVAKAARQDEGFLLDLAALQVRSSVGPVIKDIDSGAVAGDLGHNGGVADAEY
jgi:aspartokinase